MKVEIPKFLDATIRKTFITEIEYAREQSLKVLRRQGEKVYDGLRNTSGRQDDIVKSSEKILEVEKGIHKLLASISEHRVLEKEIEKFYNENLKIEETK